MCAVHNMAVLCSSLISCFPGMLLRYWPSDYEMLYAFFWVITRRLDFICRRFGTVCLFHLHRQVDLSSYPKESIQHTEQGESLKLRIYYEMVQLPLLLLVSLLLSHSTYAEFLL